MRRCPILLARAAGPHTPAIARTLRCHDQTVRTTIHACHRRGLAALQPQSSRPHTTQAIGEAAGLERLQGLFHQRPRVCGQATSLWPLALAAEGSFAPGRTRGRLSDETRRAALAPLGVRWQRAQPWRTSPEPAYLRKKTVGPACCAWLVPRPPGGWALPMRSGGAAPDCMPWRVPRRRLPRRPWQVRGCWCAAPRRLLPRGCGGLWRAVR